MKTVSYGTVLVRNYAQCTSMLLRFTADTVKGLKCVTVLCV